MSRECRRMRYTINASAYLTIQLNMQRAAKKYIVPFMMAVPEALEPGNKIVEFGLRIRGMQLRWKAQMMFQKARIRILLKIYQEELD
jgi:hypothetical protein